MTTTNRPFALLLAGTLGIGAILASAVPASADYFDRRVRITNDTDSTMTRFYASNVHTDDWEENILQGRRLRPGESIVINIDDGRGYCRFDLRADFAYGDSSYRWNYNVCENGRWRVSGW